MASAAFVPASEDIPTYFLPMLNDIDRNKAYEAAIIETINLFTAQHGRAPHVLDVGSGSGMLSIISLQNGAAHVTLAEANATLANIAGEQLKECFPDKDGSQWNIIIALSTELPSPSAGGIAYDMVVTELVGSMINSESMYVYLWDLMMRGVVNNFGDREKPSFYIVPQSGIMSMRAYKCPSATGVGTGIKYAPMDVLFNAVYGTDPTPKVSWTQDESMHVCIASSKREAVSESVEVLREAYNQVSGAVVHPKSVQLEIAANTKEELSSVVLVLEWTIKLSDTVTLYHTLDHVAALESSVRIGRWIAWGFLFAPLLSCTAPRADGVYKFTTTWAPADLIVEAEVPDEPSLTVTAPSPAPSRIERAQTISPTSVTEVNSVSVAPAATKKRRIAPKMVAPSATTDVSKNIVVIPHKQLAMTIVTTKLMNAAGETTV